MTNEPHDIVEACAVHKRGLIAWIARLFKLESGWEFYIYKNLTAEGERSLKDFGGKK